MTEQTKACQCDCHEPTSETERYGRVDEEWTELDDETRGFIDDWIAGNPGQTERLIPLLHQVQEKIGYLPFPVQQYVARALGLSPEQVYGVVSFYNFFTTTPRGHYQLKVCTGTACFVKRSQRLLEIMEEELDVELGGVTDDLMFSVDEVRCVGACGLAPAVMVNSEVLGNVAPHTVPKLLGQLREKADGKTDKDNPENTRG